MRTDSLLFTIAAIIGKTELTMEAYYELQVGDIVLLEQKIEDPLPISISEEIYYLGRPGLHGTQKAVKIDERIHIRRD